MSHPLMIVPAGTVACRPAFLALCIAALAVLSMTAAAAAPALSEDPRGESDTAHSASLAGVARWADATPADLSADATYLLPGFIDGEITLDNLRRRFGAANVTLAELDGAEGETSKGVVLFASDPARRAELFFRDEERARGIDSVRVRASRSRWHFENGIHPGMTLAQLVAANGAPVSFHGLDWDYGGTVVDWHGGKVAEKGKAVTFRSVALTHADNAKGYPLGEESYRSDDPAYPKQSGVLYVGEIGVTFNDVEG